MLKTRVLASPAHSRSTIIPRPSTLVNVVDSICPQPSKVHALAKRPSVHRKSKKMVNVVAATKSSAAAAVCTTQCTREPTWGLLRQLNIIFIDLFCYSATAAVCSSGHDLGGYERHELAELHAAFNFFCQCSSSRRATTTVTCALYTLSTPIYHVPFFI